MPWESMAPCLICPLCNSRLARSGGSLVCAHSHTFDIARDGYVNLLLPGLRTSWPRGDSKEMLRARREFLERGHFALFSDAVNALVSDYLTTRIFRHRRSMAEPVCILDVGCGEGYYLGRLQLHLSRQLESPIMYHGVDIAKDAVRLAAHRYPELHVVAADVNTRLPYPDGSLHVLLNVFAPRNPSEFARILAPGGLLTVVIPTPNHLRELRAVAPLLEIEQHKPQRVTARLAKDFVCVGASAVACDIELEGKDLSDLIRMIPTSRMPPPSGLDRPLRPGRFRVRAEVTLLRFLRL